MGIEETLRKHRDKLLRLPEVVGVGLGADACGQVILVMVTHLEPWLSEQLPETIDGYRLLVQEVGDVSVC